MVQRLRSGKFSGVTISSALVVNGVLGMVAKLSVAMVALLALTPAGDGDLRVMALVAAVTCTLVGCTTALLHSERFPLMVGGLLDTRLRRARRTFSRLPPINLRNAALRFQDNTRGLIRDRGLMLVAATVASHATLFALFVVCFRAVGMSAADVSTLELLVAFGLSRIITVVSLTPGGIGLVEVSLAATFTAMGEPPHSAIAGVLLFRSATYIVPTLGGLLVLASGFVVRRRSTTPSDATLPVGATTRPDAVLQSDATPAATQPAERTPASVP
jgi:putative heme transporter